MRRFFCEKINNGIVSIKGQDAQHMHDVLRMRKGDRLIICSLGKDYVCEITHIDSTSVECKALDEIQNVSEPAIKVTLYQGLPKADKMEYIIQKCVELGVTRIVPVCCARSIVKLDAAGKENKVSRWRKISAEASKQSGRGIIPVVDVPIRVDEIINSHDLAVMFWELDRENRLKSILGNNNFKDIGIFIGPEGGITDAEAQQLLDKGFVSSSLGKRILRTETAGIAALSALMYHYDELG